LSVIEAIPSEISTMMVLPMLRGSEETPQRVRQPYPNVNNVNRPGPD